MDPCGDPEFELQGEVGPVPVFSFFAQPETSTFWHNKHNAKDLKKIGAC